MLGGRPGGDERAVAQLVAGVGEREAHPPGHRGDAGGVLVAEREPGRGDPPRQGGQPPLDVAGRALRQQHQHPAVAVEADPLERLGGVAQQLGDLGGDLGGGTGAEALQQPRHLLELQHAEGAVAVRAAAALELAPRLLDQAALGEQAGAQVPAEHRCGHRRPRGLGAHPGSELGTADRRAEVVVGTEVEGADDLALVAVLVARGGVPGGGGEDQHGDGAARTRGAQPLQQREPVGAGRGGRHDDVGTGPREGQRGVLVAGGADDLVAGVGQGAGARTARERLPAGSLATYTW